MLFRSSPDVARQARRWRAERGIAGQFAPERSRQRASREDAGHRLDGDVRGIATVSSRSVTPPALTSRSRDPAASRLGFASSAHWSWRMYSGSVCRWRGETIRAPGRRPAWSGAGRADPAGILPRSLSVDASIERCAGHADRLGNSHRERRMCRGGLATSADIRSVVRFR